MSGETKGERMSLTKEQLDEMRALARATLSESMSQEDIRRVHTDLCSNILALLDALEEMEEARDINVATNIELIKQHAEVEEKLKAQLATAQETIARLGGDLEHEQRWRSKSYNELDEKYNTLRTTHQATVEALEYGKEQLRLVVDTLNATMDKRPRPPETSDGGSMEDLCGSVHEWELWLDTDWSEFKRALGEGKGEG